jgi:hypothetical protein
MELFMFEISLQLKRQNYLGAPACRGAGTLRQTEWTLKKNVIVLAEI